MKALPLVAAIVVCIACGRPDDQETGSIDRGRVLEAREQLDPALRAALDSGNAAYRADDFEGALRHFRRAVELDDENAAGWFGVYMAELALGNAEAAQEAVDRARALAPGATLIHPEPADTGR